MNTDNLISLKQHREKIKNMKLLSRVFSLGKIQELNKMDDQLKFMLDQMSLFMDRFSDSGWCMYDSMNFELIKRANKAFELSGINAAEKVLVEYYKKDAKIFIPRLMNSSEFFLKRKELVEFFFEDHFMERYHASIPLGLIIVDGAVNDFTKSKGFFADETSVEAWDCLVGCNESLTKVKSIFTMKRTKTNIEMITIPYRNGILHGRDINYANEYVACKCVSLLFAVAEWMKMKNSEERRKEEYEKKITPLSVKDLLIMIKQNEDIDKTVKAWQPRQVNISVDIPATGTVADFINYPYIIPVVNMLKAWEDKNFGKMALYLKNMLPFGNSAKKNAGECRKLFANKEFKFYKIIEIEEKGISFSKIILKISWVECGQVREDKFIFGCWYKNEQDTFAIPRIKNGDWEIWPQDVSGWYK